MSAERPPTNAVARALWEVGRECDNVREADVAELAREALNRHDELRDRQTDLDAFGGDGR